MNPTPSNPANLFEVLPNGNVSGPAEYMNERYREFMNDVYEGRSAVFNYGMNHKGLSISQALTVALQTDYASWKGMKAFQNRYPNYCK